MGELPTKYFYCKIMKGNDFEIYEDRNGHIVVGTSTETEAFSKRSKALKYINSQIKSGKKLATDYTLRVLAEDLAELGESKGLK